MPSKWLPGGGIISGHAYDILNSEFCNSDGTLNKDSRQYKALARMVEATDYLSTWSLKYPLTIGFYTNDYLLPFDEVQALVKDLQSRTDQTVSLIPCDFDTGIIEGDSVVHALAAYYWQFYTVNHENLY